MRQEEELLQLAVDRVADVAQRFAQNAPGGVVEGPLPRGGRIRNEHVARRRRPEGLGALLAPRLHRLAETAVPDLGPDLGEDPGHTGRHAGGARRGALGRRTHAVY